MNKRIRKKKEKQYIMEYTFEYNSVYSLKRRKKIVNKIWQMYHITKTPIKI